MAAKTTNMRINGNKDNLDDNVDDNNNNYDKDVDEEDNNAVNKNGTIISWQALPSYRQVWFWTAELFKEPSRDLV